MKAVSLRFPQSGVVLIAIVFIAMFFITALPRLLYPYDLDFLEDSMLMESLRIAQGQPVYVPPNADFNPHVYMPLFFWIGAVLFKIGGASLVLLRMISFGSTLATTILIYWIALRESRLKWIALACAGLFLAGYRINGFWYEVARVDPLFLALTVGGLALANYASDSNRGLILSGIALALAAFTKQTGFFLAIGLTLYLFMKVGQRAWFFVIPFSGLTLMPMLILNWSTDGWFFYHVIRIGSADPIEMSRLVNFAVKEIFGVMWGLSLTALMAGIIGAQDSRWEVLRKQPWLVGVGLAILISGMGRMRVGGNLNNLMPAYALLCLAPAILMRISMHQSPSIEHTNNMDRIRYQEWLLSALILIQFVLCRYSPPRYIPSPAMRERGDRLVQRIASFPGRVFVMMHPYYTLLAGKEPSTQIATLWYVRHRGELPLPEDFVNRIESHYYSAIISDESFFETQPDLHELITTYYVQTETLNLSNAPPTITGVVVRPKVIYLPK
jgi:4-amino-4-deoxy-L-arabinose transferase-like glycosyltransferase